MILGNGHNHTTDKPILVLGLTRPDLVRLITGKPIIIPGEELGIESEVMIALGDTPDEVRSQVSGPQEPGAETESGSDEGAE